MTTIEQRIEELRPERDYGREFTAEEIAKGKHRRYVGGYWDSVGKLQLDFLRDQGLRPDHRFLDVGCGSFRAGRHLVEYLQPGNYYGIDINPNIVQAGYDSELTDEQRARLPVENLRITNRFDADFGVGFDMAIAQSVFTHIPLNNIRLCLYRIAKVMRPGGVFYTTFYEQRPDVPLDKVKGHMQTDANTFWYYRADLRWAASFSPWKLTYIGKWGHPRGQRMLKFTRVQNPPINRTATGVAYRTARRAVGKYRAIRSR